jgi:hypothetical protein
MADSGYLFVTGISSHYIPFNISKRSYGLNIFMFHSYELQKLTNVEASESGTITLQNTGCRRNDFHNLYSLSLHGCIALRNFAAF